MTINSEERRKKEMKERKGVTTYKKGIRTPIVYGLYNDHGLDITYGLWNQNNSKI